MAPEVSDGDYGHSADSFGYGLILVFTVLRQNPPNISILKGKGLVYLLVKYANSAVEKTSSSVQL